MKEQYAAKYPKMITVDPTHDVYLGGKKLSSGIPKADNEFQMWKQQNPNRPVSEYFAIKKENENTEFTLWKAQNPDTPVSEYWKAKEKVKAAYEKPEKMTVSDVKSAHGLEASQIKNRMMIDMTPEEQIVIAGQPTENVLALLLSGRVGKSLSADKKKQYTDEFSRIENYYGNLMNNVMGRKGASPKKEQPVVKDNKAVISDVIKPQNKSGEKDFSSTWRKKY